MTSGIANGTNNRKLSAGFWFIRFILHSSCKAQHKTGLLLCLSEDVSFAVHIIRLQALQVSQHMKLLDPEDLLKWLCHVRSRHVTVKVENCSKKFN